MNKKRLNWYLISYELRNIIGNIFVIFFGVFFPIIMSALFSVMLKSQIPENMYSETVTGLFITMSMIIPMAVLLIGYAANYSQELEKDVPLRLNLFGFTEKTMLLAKMVSYLIFTTAAFIIYAIVDLFILDLQTPKISSAVFFVLSLYALSIIFFMLAHGLATILRKFGPTYAVCMFLYFGFMILCGMMGITVDQLPSGVKTVAKVFPMSYISSDFITFWQGGEYNFAPFVQSLLFFGAVSAIILIFSIRKNQRVLKAN
ncbi:ABC transporter permease [Anaerocolumna sp. AGMB13020]|uniref:ABC transporter permease n=1 Tax=Anaerocolumna sp. AGMB13020 TaxID=3081750 RepID=UPI002954EC47|nr:ABC transporter permease [Anaerocolumna sp. AGMB13020]WOO34557.1 ABC transporter permease [Anaerocolumna sp. AGMB13020]